MGYHNISEGWMGAFAAATETFHTAERACMEGERFAQGRLQFKLASNAACPFNMDIGRVREAELGSRSGFARLVRKITKRFDRDWRATHALKEAARRIWYAYPYAWARQSLMRSEAGQQTPVYEAIVTQLLPEAPADCPLEQYLPGPTGQYAGLSRIRACLLRDLDFDSVDHRAAFDAWLACTSSHETLQPFQAKKIMCNKSVLTDGRLTLVFAHEQREFELCFKARDESTRSQRALHRLYQLAVLEAHAGSYLNLSQLLCWYMLATIAAEAPAMLWDKLTSQLQCSHAAAGTGEATAPGVFALRSASELPRFAMEALKRAVNEVTNECVYLAKQTRRQVQQNEAMLNDIRERARPLRALAVLLPRIERYERGQSGTAAAPSDASDDKALCRDIVAGCSWVDGKGPSCADLGDVIRFPFARRLSWPQRIKRCLLRLPPAPPDVLGVPASIAEGAIRFPATEAQAKLFWRKLPAKAVKTVKDFRGLSRLLFHTPADVHWVGRAETVSAELYKAALAAGGADRDGASDVDRQKPPEAEVELFKRLLDPVRFGGRATFADLRLDKDGMHAADDVCAMLPAFATERSGSLAQAQTMVEASSTEHAVVLAVLRRLSGAPVMKASEKVAQSSSMMRILSRDGKGNLIGDGRQYHFRPWQSHVDRYSPYCRSPSRSSTSISP